MDGRISMYVLLVCVWCSLDAGGFLMVVTAEQTVSAVILTPEADSKEGGRVDMRCTARNLESDHIVEWRTEGQTLRWGETTVSTTNGRFIFDTSTDLVTQTVVQDFTITNVQRADTDEYVCNVNDPIPDGGNNIVSISSLTLSVLYFPSESFPMCSPARPITVDAGTELDMTCSSESSHGTVTMTINPTIQTSRYTTWTSVINHDIDTVVRKLDLTVDDADNGVSFECVIASMYFPNMLRTCQIGPITVRNTMTIPMTEPTTSSTSTSSTTGSTMSSTGISTPNSENGVTSSSSSTSTQSTSELSLSSAVVVGAVAGGVAAFLLIVIMILICCQRRRSGNSDPKSEQSNLDVNQTNTDLTPDSRLEISQISSNEYGLQDNIIYASSQNPLSGPGESYSGTVPVQTAEMTDPSLLYAKPFRTQTQKTEPAVTKRQPDPSDDSATEQSYSNPVFQSSVSDGTTSPSGDDLSKPIKPTALVRPTRPTCSKPRPYKPKPAERTSNTPSTHDDRMAPTSPPPTYAQVSVPMRQQSSHDNPGSADHTVYADLDLHSDDIQDGRHHPPPSSEAVLYSSVMRN